MSADNGKKTRAHEACGNEGLGTAVGQFISSVTDHQGNTGEND